MITIASLYEKFLVHPRVVIDTRQLQPGDLFFALRGDRLDGNDFADQALASGASFVIVDRPEVVKDNRYILVSAAFQPSSASPLS